MITEYQHATNYSIKDKTVILATPNGWEPAKAYQYGYEKGDDKLTEAAVQQRIFMHHWNTYSDERGLLYHNNNNSHSKRKGAIMKGAGVVPGVADLTYLHGGRSYFLEVKLPGKGQSAEQKSWQATVEEAGFQYYIIRSIADFEAVRGLIVSRL